MNEGNPNIIRHGFNVGLRTLTPTGLEVLDPTQNHTFVDNYLAVSFDLSQVLFIATANTLDTIEEKIGIARAYLIPKQLAAHGLATDELVFEPEATRQIPARLA